MGWLRAVDIGFFIAHTGLVLFNLLGWAWPRSRKWHFATMLLTATSWLIMGAWKGLGYCVCTDLHWRVREALGYRNDSPTYIHLLLKTLFGVSLSEPAVTAITAGGFLFALVMSLTLNIRDFRLNRHAVARS